LDIGKLELVLPHTKFMAKRVLWILKGKFLKCGFIN